MFFLYTSFGIYTRKRIIVFILTVFQLLAELGIPHTLRYEAKYGFEDILTVLDVSSQFYIR